MLPFATMLLSLEGITLSEIHQAEKDRYCILSIICGIKKTQNRGQDGGCQGLRVQEMGAVGLRLQTRSSKMSTSRRRHVQRGDYSYRDHTQ